MVKSMETSASSQEAVDERVEGVTVMSLAPEGLRSGVPNSISPQKIALGRPPSLPHPLGVVLRPT